MTTNLEPYQISVDEVILTSEVDHSGTLQLYIDRKPLSSYGNRLLINLPPGSETVSIRIEPPAGSWSLDATDDTGSNEAGAWKKAGGGLQSIWRTTTGGCETRVTATGGGPETSIILFNKVKQPIERPIEP